VLCRLRIDTELLTNNRTNSVALTKDNGSIISKDLHQAALANDIEKLHQLITGGGADVHATDEIGWTPLHLASLGNSFECARILIEEYDADVYAKDEMDWTPLHFAAWGGGSVDIARLLIDRHNV